MPRAPAKEASTGPALGEGWAEASRAQVANASRGDGAEQGGEHGGEARAGEVEHVVESGGGPAELEVALAAVADHGVEGVGGAVAEQPGDAGDGARGRSGATTASEVFSATDSTTARAISPSSSERGVAADEVGQPLAGLGQPARGEQVGDGQGLAFEGGPPSTAQVGERGGEQRAAALERRAPATAAPPTRVAV